MKANPVLAFGLDLLMYTAKLWQRAEGAFLLALGFCLYAYHGASFSWWAAVLIFLAPDLTFAGYLLGPKRGAIAYNLLHTYAFGAVILCIGYGIANPLVISLGALWLAHSGFDRVLGYGLKSPEGFEITHLGKIGKSKAAD